MTIVPELSLQRLNISQTRITDVGLDDVVSLKKLTELNVSGTEVTEEGPKLFSKDVPAGKIIRH